MEEKAIILCARQQIPCGEVLRAETLCHFIFDDRLDARFDKVKTAQIELRIRASRSCNRTCRR